MINYKLSNSSYLTLVYNRPSNPRLFTPLVFHHLEVTVSTPEEAEAVTHNHLGEIGLNFLGLLHKTQSLAYVTAAVLDTFLYNDPTEILPPCGPIHIPLPILLKIAHTTTWLPDTGSNSHVSHDFSSLDSHTPYLGGASNITNDYAHHHRYEWVYLFFKLPKLPSSLVQVTMVFTPFIFQRLPKVAYTSLRASFSIWHQRLGHPHSQLLNFMFSKYCLPVSSKSSDSFCNSCHIGKSSKLHLSTSSFNSKQLLDLVVCDV